MNSPAELTPNGTVQTAPRYLQQHVEYLNKRAISVDVAWKEGVRSLDEQGVRRHTGNELVTGGGLGFAYGPPLPPDWVNGYVRVVLDDRDANHAKALVPRGPVPAYVLSTSTRAAASPIFITESPAKALCLASNGWPDALGLGGVDAGFFVKGESTIQGHLEPFFPAGRCVYIAFDAGQYNNPRVANAGAKIARCLLDRNCRVFLVEIPLDGGKDQGPDDYIAGNGSDAFAVLVAGARPADPVEFAKQIANDPPRARSVLEDLPFCAALRVGGPGAIKEVATALKDYHERASVKGAYANNKVVRAATQQSHGSAPGRVIGTGAPWEKDLLRTPHGAVRSCTENVRLVLENDPRMAGVLGFDLLANDVVVLRPPAALGFVLHPPGAHWVDEDDVALEAWLAREWDIEYLAQRIRGVVALVAHRREYCPLQQRLSALAWDQKPRVSSWLTDYLGVDDTPYARAVGKMWLVSAVARIMQPGCQVDHVLVLEGPQGLGKSTILRALAFGGDYFLDDLRDLGSTECAKQLRSKWIVELAELAAVRRRELETVKAFISRRSDNYRPSYARSSRDFPRRCVFAATVNPEDGRGYLADPTGNRRWWPVLCTKADPAAIARDGDQLWAEAVSLFEARVPWHPSSDEQRALCAPQQDERREVDAWEEQVSRHLRLVDGWITTERLLRDIVGVTLDRHDALAVRRMAQVMHSVGWESTRVRTKKGRRIRAWVRGEQAEPFEEKEAKRTPLAEFDEETTGEYNELIN